MTAVAAQWVPAEPRRQKGGKDAEASGHVWRVPGDGEGRLVCPARPGGPSHFTPAGTAGGWSAAHRQEQEPIIGTPPTTTSILLRHNALPRAPHRPRLRGLRRCGRGLRHLLVFGINQHQFAVPSRLFLHRSRHCILFEANEVARADPAAQPNQREPAARPRPAAGTPRGPHPATVHARGVHAQLQQLSLLFR